MNYKLTTLTKVNSLVLFLVVLALLIVSFIGLKALRQPYDQINTFNVISERIQQNIEAPVKRYLVSGDATMLNSAEQGVISLKEYIAPLSEGLTGSLPGALIAMQQYLQGDFRAAGKLAGNPQALLLQNERELANELSRLLTYALQGMENDAESARAMIGLAGDISIDLTEKAISRHKFFNTLDQTHRENIAGISQHSLELAESLANLSLLGVLEESQEDGFFLGEPEEAADKGQEIIGNIQSLIRRYSQELDRTAESIDRIKESRNTITTLMGAISENHQATQKVLQSEFEQTLHWFQTVMIVIVCITVTSAFIVAFVQFGMVKKIKELIPYIQRYGEGDFSREVSLDVAAEEMISLKDSAGKLRTRLIELIERIKENSDAVSGVSHRVAQDSSEVQASMELQLQQSDLIMTAMGQLATSFQSVAENASSASDAVYKADQDVKKGHELVKSNVAQVNELVDDVNKTASRVEALSEETRNIDSVVTVIENIAEQTNLLALNAAIEAARAGEQGRGFAVVADEVRSLSQRTSASTQEIKNIIQRLQSEAAETVEVMNQHQQVAKCTAEKTEEAGKVLQMIVQAIELITELNTQVAGTTEEQAVVAKDIQSNLRQINELSNQTASKIERSLASSQGLTRYSQALKNSIGKFKY